ncbi:MAG: thioesterase II family protein [Angustibacter sp.]
MPLVGRSQTRFLGLILERRAYAVIGAPAHSADILLNEGTDLVHALGDDGLAVPSWLPMRPETADPSELVFVVGHAGAGIANLRTFERALPDDRTVWGLSLPGRDRDLGRPAQWDFDTVVAAAAADAVEIVDEYPDTSIVVIGQCLGAWLAFALLSRGGAHLQQRCRQLVVVSQAPWHAPRTDAPLPADSDAMWVRLVDAGDVAIEIAEDEEFRAVLEPIVRADFAALDQVPTHADALACPIHVVEGRNDPQRAELVHDEWARYATAIDVTTVESGHLPLQDAPAAVAALLTAPRVSGP